MDAFTADFVKALPEALATAVVTVLLAGVVLFLFQKKIEASLARSLFEYQTKFSRSFPKTVEILETYTKKVYKASRFAADFQSLLEPLVSYYYGKYEIYEDGYKMREEELGKILAGFVDTSDDSFRYLRDNRLYLSDTILKTIETIWKRELKLSGALQACMSAPTQPLGFMSTIRVQQIDPELFLAFPKDETKAFAYIYITPRTIR
jgi:hypothetical protein